MRSILICLRKSKLNILKKSDTKKENHHLNIVSISPERQKIAICSGDRHLSGGSGGVVYLDKWGRMPDSVMLIEPSRYPDMQGVMGWDEGGAG